MGFPLTTIVPPPSSLDSTLRSWAARPFRALKFWVVPLLGLLLALLQLGVVWSMGGFSSAEQTWARLCWGDSVWYASISTDGYQCDVNRLYERAYAANVGFFPLYPGATAALMAVTHLPVHVALPVTAQLACWGFWSYLLLIFRQWNVSAGAATVGILAIAVYPSAFYLVVGYSESLFLLTLLGFLFWQERPGWWARVFAGLHGAGMTATRFVGAAVVVVPLVRGWEAGRGRSKWLDRLARSWPSLAVAGVACLGMGLFFGYCQFRFGHWNIYQIMQEWGWGNQPDYWSVLRKYSYRYGPIFQPDGTFAPDCVGRWCAVGLLLLGVVLLVRESASQDPTGRVRRIGLYAAASIMFFGVMSAGAPVAASLVRHALPIHVLLVLAGVHMVRGRREGESRLAAWIVGASFGCAAFALQLYLAYRYTHGLWVA